MSQAELDDQLNIFLNGKGVRPNISSKALSQTIEDWFYAIDGSSSDRVASAILSRINKDNSRNIRLKNLRSIHYGWAGSGIFKMIRNMKEDPLTGLSTFDTIKWQIGIAIRMYLGLPVTWDISSWSNKLTNVQWDQSEKYFDAEKVFQNPIRKIPYLFFTIIVSWDQQSR